MRALGIGFLAILAVVAAEATQAVGALLLFGLLAAPAGAARLLTCRPWLGFGLSAAIAVGSTWVGLALSYEVPSLPAGTAVDQRRHRRFRPRRPRFAPGARDRGCGVTTASRIGEVTTAAASSWKDHAFATMADAGLRRGGARTAVVEALAGHDCAVTALDLDEELRRRDPAPGRASVYRALEQLEQLGLVQRIEVCRGTAGYERVDPTGHHHHHAICRECGRMVPFEDPQLEQAIGQVSAGHGLRGRPSTTWCCGVSARGALRRGCGGSAAPPSPQSRRTFPSNTTGKVRFDLAVGCFDCGRAPQL